MDRQIDILLTQCLGGIAGAAILYGIGEIFFFNSLKGIREAAKKKFIS